MTAIAKRTARKTKPWNRCDGCGKFIAKKDFDDGTARHRLVSEDTAFTAEEFETLCSKCNGEAK